LHQVGTSSLLIYMMHGHTYIRTLFVVDYLFANNITCFRKRALMLFRVP